MATPKRKKATPKRAKTSRIKRDNKKAVGRPPYVKTASDESVVQMYAAWATQEQIADRLQISVETLVKYFPDELRICKLEADNFAFCKLMENVKAGDPASIIWYTKARMGWREGHILEQRKVEIYREFRQSGDLDKLTIRELTSLYFDSVGGVRSSLG